MTDALMTSPVPAYHDALIAAGWTHIVGGYTRLGRVCDANGPKTVRCTIQGDLLDIQLNPVDYAEGKFAARVAASEAGSGPSPFVAPAPHTGELHNHWLTRLGAELQSYANRKFAEIDERVDLALAKVSDGNPA